MSEVLKRVPTDEVVETLYNDLRRRIGDIEPNDAMVAPDYADLTLPILVGTRCTHNRGLYKCNTQINSSEAWDSTHWDEITVGSELDSLQSEVEDKYEKPSGGIPASDLAEGVIPSVPVQDVQIAGTSVLQSGVANIPESDSSTLGVVMIGDGLSKNAVTGKTNVQFAPDSFIKLGGNAAQAISPARQHTSVFYGLTKAAGVDMAGSDNTVGTYTDQAKRAIQTMIGVTDVTQNNEERDGIVQATDTATKNITAGKYVIWKGSLYTASVNIATGETLSLSNLNPVDDGGFNDLKTQIINMKKEKFYQKFDDYDGSYVNLQQLVPFDVYDEIVILIYQSNTSETAWSNTDWNAFFVQNENNSNIAAASYLKGSVNHIIRIKRYKEVVTAEFTNSSNVPTVNRYITGNSEIKIKRIRIDAVSSTTKAGCTIEVYVF